jgi:hypothetical protein
MSSVIKTWSPSALKAYEECPRRTKYERVDYLCPKCFKGRLNKRGTCDKCGREKPPEAPALARGTALHEEAEMYIRGQRKTIHPDLKKVAKELRLLKADYAKQKVRVELNLAFTQDWKMTGWTDEDVYVRFKVDVLHFPEPKLSVVKDWKTGKLRPGEVFDDQLMGYAVASLTAGFGERTRAELIFTDQGQTVTSEAGELTLVQLPKAQKALDKRASKMMNDPKFNPRPGNYCRWCAFSANNGGPCRF